jgi:hypothetical protein
VALSLLPAAGRAAPAPPAPCLPYAPAVVELIGVLQREGFEQQPLEDLFVDPNDVEVEGTPPPGMAAVPPEATTSGPPTPGAARSGPGPTSGSALTPPPVPPPETAPLQARRPEDALSSTAPPPADPALPPTDEQAGLPWPADAIGPPPPPWPPPPDPVLLRARPVKRPLPKEQVWVLTLPKPACLRVEAEDLINKPAKNIRKMQLVVEQSLEPTFRLLAKKRVVVRGQLFYATTRRHYLPILINVEDLRPPEWVQDTTQLPPPPP